MWAHPCIFYSTQEQRKRSEEITKEESTDGKAEEHQLHEEREIKEEKQSETDKEEEEEVKMQQLVPTASTDAKLDPRLWLAGGEMSKLIR